MLLCARFLVTCYRVSAKSARLGRGAAHPAQAEQSEWRMGGASGQDVPAGVFVCCRVPPVFHLSNG